MDLKDAKSYIMASAKKLNLSTTTTREAIKIYNEVSSNPEFADTRIRDESIAIASVYVANRLHQPKPLEQTVFIYRLPISFATLRKCYIHICSILDISRERIVPKRHFS